MVVVIVIVIVIVVVMIVVIVVVIVVIVLVVGGPGSGHGRTLPRAAALRRGVAAGPDRLVQSNDEGRSTTLARTYSPRLLACPSCRDEAATPSSSRPTITKLSDQMLGRA